MGRLSKSAFAILWLSFGAGLTGCGFTPLYATPGMTPSLQAIDLVVPKERIGYLLEEQLNDELGHKSASPIRYQLTCTTKVQRYPRGVRVNNVANRYEINLTVNYTLRVAGGSKVLLQGAAPAIVDYDSADPPYAGVAAEQDGGEPGGQSGGDPNPFGAVAVFRRRARRQPSG